MSWPAAESWEVFWERMRPKGDTTHENIQLHYKIRRQEWIEQEKQSAAQRRSDAELRKQDRDYRASLARSKRLAQEAEEKKLKEEQRKKEREARDAQRKKDLEQREVNRKREREQEQERRDPTPFFHPPDYPISIPYSIRDQHIFVPGGTRLGKSTQLQNIIMHDIMQGQGVAVLDPKRDLLRAIVHSLPAQRIVDGKVRNLVDDIIFLDKYTPIPFNFLDRNPENTERVVNDLIYIITKGDTTLKAAEPLLEKIIRAFLLIPDTTITDMYRFISFKTAQTELLAKLNLVNPELGELFHPFPKDGVGTLERRLSPFYLNPKFKAIFDARTPPLNFSEIMDNKKILLVDLSPPRDRDAAFYGSLVMAQIMSAINERSGTKKYTRSPFFLHVDEFEYFQTDSFADLLSVAGGLGLRLTLGNQYLDQVLTTNLKAILGNIPTYIFFALDQDDASRFRARIAPYDTDRLAQLKPYQACFKIGSNEPIFKWTERRYVMTEKDEDAAERLLDKLREITITRYAEETSAESGQIRTVDNEALHSHAIPHTEVNGRHNKDEDIKPGQSPTKHRS